MTTAVVIGAGLGGLALAIRLQSAGIATTIVEARDQPGGCAGFRQCDGYTFDTGPTAITDPDSFAALWALSGQDMAADVTLDRIEPFCRFNWPDGTNFDLGGDDATVRAEIGKLDPADVAGYARLLDHAAGARREFGDNAFPDLGAMVRAVPLLARYQAWRSVYSTVSRFVRNEKLRQALSFYALLAGGNPMTASAIHAPWFAPGGLWSVRGGTNRLVAALAALFERLGGTIRPGDAAVRIETLGDRVTAVETASGWRADCAMLAANSDAVHTYRDLLAGSAAARRGAERLARRRYSPSLFLLHFGIRGTWPGIPHRMVLFGPRYREQLADIYEHGILSPDFPISLAHPSVTDPSLAPEGCSTFQALVPVPHLGRFPEDWARIAPIMERRVLDEIGRRLIPDVHERIVTRFSHTPVDFAHDLHAHLGSAFGPEPLPAQSGWFRVHNRDDAIGNLYFVGAATHPGAGIPGVLSSAKATADLMLGRA